MVAISWIFPVSSETSTPTPFILCSQQSALCPLCVFRGEIWSWQVLSEPDWCLASLRMDRGTGSLCVWHFRATWSQACRTDNVPWGEVVSETATLFIYFSLIPRSQGGSCVWRLSCLRYLCSLLLLLSQCYTLYQKCSSFLWSICILSTHLLKYECCGNVCKWSIVKLHGVKCSLLFPNWEQGLNIIEEKHDCQPVSGGPSSNSSCYVSTATSKSSILLVYGCGACSFKIPMRLHPVLSLSGRMI